jgi:hypothetical protein
MPQAITFIVNIQAEEAINFAMEMAKNMTIN